jgi:ribonuclease G
MRKAMSRDRAKSVIFPLTQLGLMQITRQRIHQNIADKLYDECTNCNGTGRVYNKSLVLANIEKWIRVFKNNSNEQKVMLLVSHDLADYLTEGPNNKLSKLMVKYFLKIKLQRSENLHSNTFRFYSLRYQKDITQEFSNVS